MVTRQIGSRYGFSSMQGLSGRARIGVDLVDANEARPLHTKQMQ